MMMSPLVGAVVASPNVEARRELRAVDMIVLHYTGMTSAIAARDWLCNPASGVSCHYLVDEAGFITQMVGEEMRAWHAGVSSWEGETDTNSRSIGIEIQHPGHGPNYGPFPVVQVESVAALCRDIAGRHGISPRRVLAHSDVAPGRKIDPGEAFDWQALARKGVGLWVAENLDDALLEQPLLLQRILRNFGYGIEEVDGNTEKGRVVVAAFQRHFRPSLVTGLADAGSLDTAQRLARLM